MGVHEQIVTRFFRDFGEHHFDPKPMGTEVE
jgi:hypothetical protein